MAALESALELNAGAQGVFDSRIKAYETGLMVLEDMDSQRLEIKASPVTFSVSNL